jgi:hypothetical protein
MRRGSGEASIEKIRGWSVGTIGLGSVSEALGALRPKAQRFHSGLNTLAAHASTLPAQSAMNTWAAVPVFAALVDGSDLDVEQGCILSPRT